MKISRKTNVTKCAFTEKKTEKIGIFVFSYSYCRTLKNIYKNELIIQNIQLFFSLPFSIICKRYTNYLQ